MNPNHTLSPSYVKLLLLTLASTVMVFSIFGSKKSPGEKFWEWFASKSEDFYNFSSTEDPLLFEISKQLSKVDKGLTFQFGPIDSVSKKRELVISPGGISSVIPAALKLVDMFPVMKQWDVIAFRQRIDDPTTVIKLNQAQLSVDDVYFEDMDEGDKTGLKLYIKNYDGSNDYGSAVFIMLDWLLGEYDVMTRVGSIEFKMLNEEDKQDLKPLKELPKLIDAKKEQSRN